MYANEIILAEDDPTDATFFKRALNRLDDPPRLAWYQSGTEVLAALRERQQKDELPRLAILDIKMPGMNGIELLHAIKANPEFAHLPVLIMSSSDEKRDIKSAYAAGANGYLVKPNRFQDLRQLVRSIHQFWLRTNRLRPPSFQAEA